jgi:predicted PurR-regulated permease PerM
LEPKHEDCPVNKDPWLRSLIVLGVLFVGTQLFGVIWDFARHFSDIILIFVLAWLIAFLLNPAVEFLTVGRRTPRVLAVGGVYLGLLAFLIAIGLLVIPPTATQISALGVRFPDYVARASVLLSAMQSWFDDHHVALNLQQSGVGQNLAAQAQALGETLASHALELAQSVVIAIFDGVIVLVISFYMMMDAPRITRALLSVTPARFRDDAGLLLASIDHSFGGYLRSSLTLVLVYAAGTGIAMSALGLPFVLPVSTFAGVMLVIPFVGDIVAIIPPVVIGLLTVSFVRASVLLVVMIVLQQLVLQVLRPKIMGKSVGLHPLWVLAAFLVGARVAGIWGALFSVPLAAIVQTIVQLYYYRAAGNPDREGALSRSLRGERPDAPKEPDRDRQSGSQQPFEIPESEAVTGR